MSAKCGLSPYLAEAFNFLLPIWPEMNSALNSYTEKRIFQPCNSISEIQQICLWSVAYPLIRPRSSNSHFQFGQKWTQQKILTQIEHFLTLKLHFENSTKMATKLHHLSPYSAEAFNFSLSIWPETNSA